MKVQDEPKTQATRAEAASTEHKAPPGNNGNCDSSPLRLRKAKTGMNEKAPRERLKMYLDVRFLNAVCYCNLA